jgi:hypothetical protein
MCLYFYLITKSFDPECGLDKICVKDKLWLNLVAANDKYFDLPWS